MQTFKTIPFTTESGLWKANGIAKFSAAGIILEFEPKLIGLVSTGIKEARLPIDDIFDVKFHKGMFRRGARIEVRTKSITGLKGLPVQDGKLKLKVLPEDFELAQKTAADFRRVFTDYMDTLPPPHTPVSALFEESEDATRKLDPEE